MTRSYRRVTTLATGHSGHACNDDFNLFVWRKELFWILFYICSSFCARFGLFFGFGDLFQAERVAKIGRLLNRPSNYLNSHQTGSASQFLLYLKNRFMKNKIFKFQITKLLLLWRPIWPDLTNFSITYQNDICNDELEQWPLHFELIKSAPGHRRRKVAGKSCRLPIEIYGELAFRHKWSAAKNPID